MERSWIENNWFRFYNWYKRSRYRAENLLLRDKRTIFFGDSITDYCDLKKYYPGLSALNRGIAGNTTDDLLKRLEVSVSDAHPDKVVLLIGINDLMNEKRPVDYVAFNYEKIIESIKKDNPDCRLICQSVYPGWDGAPGKRIKRFPIAYLAEDIVRLNMEIEKLCREYDCIYADIHSVLKRNDNTMIPDYSDDGCHPNSEGYKVVSRKLKEYI